MNLSANDGEGHARILSGAALLQQTKHRWDHTPIPSQLNARAKVGIELVNLRTINRKRHLRRTRLFFYIPRTVPAACRLPCFRLFSAAQWLCPALLFVQILKGARGKLLQTVSPQSFWDTSKPRTVRPSPAFVPHPVSGF